MGIVACAIGTPNRSGCVAPSRPSGSHRLTGFWMHPAMASRWQYYAFFVVIAIVYEPVWETIAKKAVGLVKRIVNRPRRNATVDKLR